MKPRISLRRSTVAAIACALLAGCGGGGDGNDATVTIPTGARSVAASAGSDARADNLGAIGTWLARAVLSVSSDGAFSVISGGREQPQAVSPQGRSASGTPRPLHAAIVHRVLAAAVPGGTLRERPSALSSDVFPCDNAGGNFVVTFNDGDENRKLSGFDRIEVQFNNCQVDTGMPVANGTLIINVNAAEVKNDIAEAVDFTINMSGFDLGAYGRYDGSLRLWGRSSSTGTTSTETTRLSYLGTGVVIAGQAAVFDFDLVGSTSGATTTFDLTGGLGVGGQTYSMVADATLSATEPNPPVSGSLRLRDAAGDAVRLVAKAAGLFDLEYYPSGATAPGATLTDLRWQDMLATPG